MIFDYTFISFLVILIAYLLGSISSSILISRFFLKKDIRDYGSKNAGAMNSIRILGFRIGLIVLLLDSLKGFIAVSLPYIIDALPQEIHYKIILAVAVIIGHIFPVYYNFKGGKGVATLLGVMLALHLKASLLSLVVYTLVLFITRYASLSSICGVLSFPIILIFGYDKWGNHPLVIFALFMGFVIVITHYENIIRLIKGKETKLKL